jgi:CheY-like chemotaxis protein
VRLDGFLADMRPLLGGALGDTVRLELRLGAADLGCRIDPAQLEAAVLNLIVNARDALTPNGGTVVISTSRLAAAEASPLELPEGEYLVFSVADDGPGMPPEVAARAFEPFFTTKQIGQGSGLGLSHVYGFARQSGGWADIESTPGYGATVRLYLPVATGAVESPEAGDRPRDHVARPREILLVEDDALVSVVAENILTELGHVVTRAEDGVQALGFLAGRNFDALVTDVRMPGGLNGVALAEEAVRRQPQIKVLLCSGWTEDALGEELRGARWPLLLKPFDSARMQAALQAVLAG